MDVHPIKNVSIGIDPYPNHHKSLVFPSPGNLTMAASGGPRNSQSPPSSHADDLPGQSTGNRSLSVARSSPAPLDFRKRRWKNRADGAGTPNRKETKRGQVGDIDDVIH